MVDFKEAKLLDRTWWRRLSWLLDELESQEALQLIQLKFHQHASSLNYEAGKTFDHHWKILNDLSSRWINIAFPWLETKTESGLDLTQKWKLAYGNTNDPETQKRIQATVDNLKKYRAPDKQPTSQPGCAI